MREVQPSSKQGPTRARAFVDVTRCVSPSHSEQPHSHSASHIDRASHKSPKPPPSALPLARKLFHVAHSAHLRRVQVVHDDSVPADRRGTPAVAGWVVESVPVVDQQRVRSRLLHPRADNHVVERVRHVVCELHTRRRQPCDEMCAAEKALVQCMSGAKKERAYLMRLANPTG
jgi:hypothetical protein